MLFVSEAVSASLINCDLAYAAVAAAFRSVVEEPVGINPVVVGRGIAEDESFALKSATVPRKRLIGVKIGSYWPGNRTGRAAHHASTILLLDADTGDTRAVIEGNALNGFRTAAADAVAVAHLSRMDSAALAVIGAGHQAAFEINAICRVRPITRIFLASRSMDSAQRLAASLSHGLQQIVVVTSIRKACENADIIVTVTPARAPVLDSSWIRPGSHISSMGSDQKGKQELPIELLHRGRLFADLAQQSVEIGEFQQFSGQQAVKYPITSLGQVLIKEKTGRLSADEITIFDSSGLAVQDLFVAEAFLSKAIEMNAAIQLP